jgi:hypothetical protein
LLDPIASTLLTAVISAVVSSLVAMVKAGGKKAIERTEAEKAADEAMRAGMRALLWRELQAVHAHAMDRGGVTVSERRHLESVYQAYHGLGGNGTGTRLYSDAMSMSVID